MVSSADTLCHPKRQTSAGVARTPSQRGDIHDGPNSQFDGHCPDYLSYSNRPYASYRPMHRSNGREEFLGRGGIGGPGPAPTDEYGHHRTFYRGESQPGSVSASGQLLRNSACFEEEMTYERESSKESFAAPSPQKDLSLAKGVGCTCKKSRYVFLSCVTG